MNKFKFSYGIVQGRLTVSPLNELQRFPQGEWEKEFQKAKEADIEFIELLTEREFNIHNPVWSAEGRKKINSLCNEFNRSIYSICSDYIINHSLLEDTNNETKSHIEKLFVIAQDLKCKVIVLPLLEKSSINSKNLKEFVPLIKYFSSLIEPSDENIIK